MNYNPRPKDDFQRDPEAVKNHNAIVQNVYVRKGLEIALAEMQRAVADRPPGDMGGMAASMLQLIGAHQLINEFLNLTQTAVVRGKEDQINLASNIVRAPAMAAKK